jgi:hypothetical protein
MKEIGQLAVTLVSTIVLAGVTPMCLQLPIILQFGMKQDLATRAEPVPVRSSPGKDCESRHGRADTGCRYPDIRRYN